MFGTAKRKELGQEYVRRVGLEPTRPETPAPKAGASASSATGAFSQPIGLTS